MLVKDAARLAAAKVLDEHWAPDKFPVDPVTIARSLGAEVYTADLDFETSGYVMKTSGASRAQIVLNRNHSPRRQTFTCAHELGHYYERLTVPQSPDEEYSFIDYRDASRRRDLHELYADEFAGCLLMPPYKIDELHDFGYSVSRLADYFEVSNPAVQIRLRRLGLAQ